MNERITTAGGRKIAESRSALIAVCTYKRIHLLPNLLAVIALQIAELPPEYKVRVALIDNDPDSSAGSELDKLSVLFKLGDLHYCHEQAPGVGNARNRAFSLAQAEEWLIFFDDDQVPCELWLKTLMQAPSRLTGDVFVGPVRPVMPVDYPLWAEGAWAWSRPEYRDGQLRDHAGFGNIMLSPSALLDPACRVVPSFLNGPGEDTSVTSALMQRGFQIVHVRDAAATELVTKERLSVAWVLARSRTAGQTWAQLALETRTGRTRLGVSFAILLCRALALRTKAIAMKSMRDEVRSKAYLSTALGYVSAMTRYITRNRR